MIPQISIIQLYLSIRIIADSWNMLDTVMYTKVFIFFFLPFNHALANPIKVFLPVDRASWNETGIRITRRHGRANKRGSTKMALPQGDLQVRGDSVSNVSFFFSIRCQCERRPRRGSLCLSEDSLYIHIWAHRSIFGTINNLSIRNFRFCQLEAFRFVLFRGWNARLAKFVPGRENENSWVRLRFTRVSHVRIS